MDGVKSLFASKTFWAGVLAILAGILGFFGWTMTADDQQALIDLGVGIGSSIAGLLTIYGRIKATKEIK